MAKVTEQRCDRCERVLGREPYITVTFNYHHPRTIDLCRPCENTVCFWLGKSPGPEGASLETILEGKVSGVSYPSREQIEAYKKDGTIIPAPFDKKGGRR